MSETKKHASWYRSGDALKPTVITTDGKGNATYSTLGTWYTIRDTTPTYIQTDYTAPTDVVLLLALQFGCLTDTAARVVEMCIMDSGLTVLTYGAMYFATAGVAKYLTIVGTRAFAAGETTTLMGRVSLPAGSAQTVTMISAAVATRLIYVPIVI